MREFFREIKRRGVYQTIAIYVVGAWVVLQVADLAFESWGLPDAALQSVWMLALVLFPLALVIGWRYDITTTGIVRTPGSEGIAPSRLSTSDYAVIGTIGVATVAAILVFANNLDQYSRSSPTPPRQLDSQSIAVLPFRSLGDVEQTGYFSDGVHDDLLTTLANISNLKVISRTSVLQYRDTEKNLRQIGEELGAANILEGGVQHVGGQVRINVQLINAETDEHIWAEKYDRAMTVGNLFAIQSEIAETIAQALTVTLSAQERTRIRSDRTDNLQAFEAFNRGKQNFVRQTFESLRTAESNFREAVELDPDYLLARVLLARTCYRLVATGAEPLEYMLHNGRQHIDHAIKIDPNDGHALAVLAIYDSAAGASNVDDLFLRALAQNPNNVDVLDIYATHLRRQGLNREALQFIDRALEFDPLSTALWHDLGRAKVALGQFEDANIAFERIAQIDPRNPYASHGAALATILGGQFANAVYWGEINARSDVDDYENTSTLAQIYMSLGDFGAARRVIDSSLALGPMEPYPLSVEAVYLTMHEQRDAAVDIARTALANELADRWGSERVFLRTMRDEALATGRYDEALGWYRRQRPEFFEDDPLIIAPTVQRAADLGKLLQAAGEDDRARTVLEAVIADYDDEYVRGAANYPMGIAKAEALALLGRNDDAIAELQRVVADGWRALWQWDTRFNRNFDGLRADPRFEEIQNLIRKDLAEQVASFREPQ